MENNRYGTSGSIAVEAALIVPIVIIAVLVVIYIILLIFQSCMMQIMADRIAEQMAGAYYGSVNPIDHRASKDRIEGLKLYRRLSGNPGYDQTNFNAAVLGELSKKSILKGTFAMEATKSGSIVNQQVNVVLEGRFSNPLGSLLSGWGIDKRISLRVQASAGLDDPVEFLRSTDYILEAASEVPIIREFQGKWQQLINKIVEFINKASMERGAAGGQS